MKYSNKCSYCSRKAERKFRGEYFCSDCLKFVKRTKLTSFHGKPRLLFNLGSGLRVYKDIPVRLK